MISKLVKPSRILEIGTFTGYSALCLAEGLTDQGELITIDRDDELKSIQTEFLEKSPIGNRISCFSGNALTILPELEGTFDLIFLDADKENYHRYLPLILERSVVGTFILIDNMLWEGKVLDEKQKDPQTESIRFLTSEIERDPRLTQVLLPVRDGLMVIRIDSL
jgi:predicted O-methyltransferase YrrM